MDTNICSTLLGMKRIKGIKHYGQYVPKNHVSLKELGNSK